jgi:small subunit ribosomal protein S13
MARISGVELEDKLKVDYALTKIKGIGWALSTKILNSLKIDSSKRVSDLTSDDISKIVSKMDKHPIEGELMRKVRECQRTENQNKRQDKKRKEKDSRSI